MPDAILMGFMPLPDEIDPLAAMQQWLDEGGRLAVPVTDWETRTMRAAEVRSLDNAAFVARKHGIREPSPPVFVPAAELAVVMVPGLAFDASGHRLGRGAGFYDRFLAGVSCPTIGVCYGPQLLASVPIDSHDHLVQRVVTA
jgi:5-formyltetrahydrofolate cyclo-ligase